MKLLSKLEIDNIIEKGKVMNEKQYRQYLFKIADSLGKGGISYVARKFHISENTLRKAREEIKNNDFYKEGDKIRIISKLKYLEDDDIKIINEKQETMNEKERRQFLFKIFKSIESKRGSLSFICTTFKINKRSLYKAKVELETGDIWQSGDAIRRKKRDEIFIESCTTSLSKENTGLINVESSEDTEISNIVENINPESTYKLSCQERCIPSGIQNNSDLIDLSYKDNAENLNIQIRDETGLISTTSCPKTCSTSDTKETPKLNDNLISSKSPEETDTAKLELQVNSESSERYTDHSNMKFSLNTIEIENINIMLEGFNEKQKRQFLFLKSKEIENGIHYISDVFHISQITLNRAKLEIESGDIYRLNSRIRKEGGGRSLVEKKTKMKM